MSICHQFDKNPLFSVFWSRIAVSKRKVITVSLPVSVKFGVSVESKFGVPSALRGKKSVTTVRLSPLWAQFSAHSSGEIANNRYYVFATPCMIIPPATPFHTASLSPCGSIFPTTRLLLFFLLKWKCIKLVQKQHNCFDVPRRWWKRGEACWEWKFPGEKCTARSPSDLVQCNSALTLRILGHRDEGIQ